MTGSPAAQTCLLYFDDERPAAERLAAASGLALRPVQRHRFPDGELKLTLPVDGAGQLPVRAAASTSPTTSWSNCCWPPAPRVPWACATSRWWRRTWLTCAKTSLSIPAKP